MGEVDWLPSAGWDKGHAAHADTAGRMGDFIAKTMELHKFYLDRLQGVKDEGQLELTAIAGVMETPPLGFADAVGPVVRLLKGLDSHVRLSYEFGQQHAGTKAAGSLSAHEIAALHLYTAESAFYRQLNATLRHPDRDQVKPYFGYLRLFLGALSKLKGHTDSLWRGVALDLRPQYPRGGTVTWWGVSSCTSKLSVAQGFLGWRGRRMLFEVRPVGIHRGGGVHPPARHAAEGGGRQDRGGRAVHGQAGRAAGPAPGLVGRALLPATCRHLICTR
jgi:hypothetical protein